MGELSGWHWLIVLAVVVLLFGTAKLPQLARSLGQSARVFKAETRALREDGESAQQHTQEQQPNPRDSGSPSTESPSRESQRDKPDT